MPPEGPNARVQRRTMYANAIRRTLEACQAPQFQEAGLEEAKNLLRAFDAGSERFHQACADPEPMTDQDFNEQEEIITRIEQIAVLVRTLIQKRIAQLEPVAPQGQAGPEQPVRVELTTADMPANQNTWGKFDGTLFRWQSFRDKFRASVHENERIKPVFKLQYLSAALTGQAADVVGSRPATEAGYNSAWTRLCEVFDDEYMLVQAILRTISALPVQEQATQEGLRKLIDTMHEAVRQLTTLGVAVDAWDSILVFMVTERLDPQTRDAWEMQRVPGMPTFEAVCAFLERRARSLAHAQVEVPRAGMKRKEHPTRAKVEVIPSKVAKTAESGSKTHGQLAPCRQCQQAHPIYRCPTFMAMELAKRKEMVRKWGLCFNCLRSGHDQSKCGFGPCLRCPNEARHNSALCPLREQKPTTSAAAVSNPFKQPRPFKQSKQSKQPKRPKQEEDK